MGSRKPTRRLTRRNLKSALLTEILEWLGKENVEAGISRKEALGLLVWRLGLTGDRPAMRLLFEYLVGKPAVRVSDEAAEQTMAQFTTEEAAEALGQLALELGGTGKRDNPDEAGRKDEELGKREETA